MRHQWEKEGEADGTVFIFNGRFARSRAGGGGGMPRQGAGEPAAAARKQTALLRTFTRVEARLGRLPPTRRAN